MPSAATLDFEGLLKPFEGPTASGKDLRPDSSPSSLYQLLKEDRKAARQLETRISKGDTEVPSPEWRPVVEKATKILAEQSKDLEVCAYLIEALVRVHGFAGMRDGYRLAGELVERFWDDGLYPSPGETDVERRCAHLLQLNGLDAPGALIPPIGRIPFTEMTSLGQFSRVQLQEAQALAKIADPKARQAKIDGGMHLARDHPAGRGRDQARVLPDPLRGRRPRPGGVRAVQRGGEAEVGPGRGDGRDITTRRPGTSSRPCRNTWTSSRS